MRSMDLKVDLGRVNFTPKSYQSMESLPLFLQCTPLPLTVLTNSSDIDHGRLRRILGTGFTNSALAAVEPNIKSHVLRLCKRLAMEARKGPVDLAKWFACFSLDVLLLAVEIANVRSAEICR